MKAFENRLIPKIPLGVWKDRMKRLRTLMADKGLDAMLIWSANMDVHGREWLRYFANIAAGTWNVEAFTLIPLEDDPAVILNFEYLLPVAKSTSPIKDIRAYESFDVSLYSPNRYKDMIPVLKGVLSERKLEGKKIGVARKGMHGDRMPELTANAIKKVLTDLRITSGDESDLLFELIRVKTDYDLRMIRKACEITCKSMKATFESVREGITDMELSGIFYNNAYDLGCQPCRYATDQHFVILGGRGTEVCNTVFPGPLTFKKGDMLACDVGLLYQGYRTDMARTAIMGKLTARQRKIYETNLKAELEMEKALRPGVRASELARINFEVAERAGFNKHNVHYIQGHGIGILENEPPILRLWENMPIEKNMTFNLECWLGKLGVGHSVIEDTYLMTNKGAERLTTAIEREIHEL